MKTRLLTMLLAAFLVAQGAAAQTKMPTETIGKSGWIDPGWRRATARYFVTFDAKGLSRTVFEYEVKLTDEKGLRSVAQQTFPYNSYFSELSSSDLVTVKADGRLVPVDERAIKDQPASTDTSSPYYDERRVRTISYPDVAVGDSVKGRLTFSAKMPVLPGEFAEYWTQARDMPPERLELTLDAPASKPLRVATRDVEHSEERIGDRIIHHVLFRQEIPEPLIEGVDAFDTARRFEASTFEDYHAFAAIMNGRNAPMAMPDEALKKLSADIVGDAVTTRAKAELIYNWVATHIRYVGIGLEEGGWTSQPATAVLASRYGDCKAHVTILKALLAAQGIEANFVAVNLGTKLTLTELAMPNFDHAIAYLPDLDLYLDPTSQVAPFGALSTQLYGKAVLNIDKGVLARIPSMKPEDFRVQTDMDITLHADGTRSVRSTLSGTGVGASLGRVYAQYLETVDRAELAKRKLLDTRLNGTGDYTFPDLRELSSTFAISAPFEITQPVALDKWSRIRLLAFTDPRPSMWQLISGGVRSRAFRCLPLDHKDTVSLSLPDGTNLLEKPASLSFEKSFSGETSYRAVTGRVEMQGAVELDGRTLHSDAHIRFSFSAPICPAEFAVEIKAALAKWDEFKFGSIGLTPNAVSRIIEGGSSYEAGLTAYRSRNYAEALKQWMRLAEQGNADAQVYIGTMYNDGQGLPQDYGKAFEWYSKAAAQGNRWAWSHLGYMYQNGQSVAKDYEQALQWYRKAAEKDDSFALEKLGDFYEYGQGVPKDLKLAIEWYLKAADRGSIRASTMLGFIHENGKGVPQDYGEAAKHYRRAADQGDSWAQQSLGVMYGFGRGVPQDYKTAADWFRQSADRGNSLGEYNLGFIYENGLGLTSDRQLAIEWYTRAAAQGHAGAKSRLDALTSENSSSPASAFSSLMRLFAN